MSRKALCRPLNAAFINSLVSVRPPSYVCCPARAPHRRRVDTKARGIAFASATSLRLW